MPGGHEIAERKEHDLGLSEKGCGRRQAGAGQEGTRTNTQPHRRCKVQCSAFSSAAPRKEQTSDGGGSGGRRGSGGRVASEDGHRDGHSRERGTRWCKSPGLPGRPDVWEPGPAQDYSPGATAAGHYAEDQGATPAPPGPALPDCVPTHARWSEDAGGCPELKGTTRPGVGHQRPPDGPRPTAWAPPDMRWHSPTTGYRYRSSGADKGPQGGPNQWKSRNLIPDPQPVSWCPPAQRQRYPKLRPETAMCPTLQTRGQMVQHLQLPLPQRVQLLLPQ